MELFRRGHGIKNLPHHSCQRKCWGFRPVKIVQPGTFLMISYILSHLFQSLFFIHITLRISSHKPKYEKQTIFLIGAIKQKYICPLNNCLSDLFYLGIHKYLMFEVFMSYSVTVREANKTWNFWDLYMYIHCRFP